MNKKEYEEFSKTYQSLYEKAVEVSEARNKIYEEVLGETKNSLGDISSIDFRYNDIRLLGRQDSCCGASEDYLPPEFLYDTDNALAEYRSELEDYVTKLKQEEADREKQRVDKEYQEYLKLKSKFE